MALNKSEYYELPSKYNQTVLRLLMQSPKRIYAYWDVSDTTLKMFSEKHYDYNQSTPILRVINVTKNYYYEIPIGPFANNYYIDIEEEDCQYKVDLGRVYKNHFIDIYMSNTITVPRSTPDDFQNDDDEILFRNYICLDRTKKMKINLPRHMIRQDYSDLPFGSDTVSSIDNMKKKI